MNKFRDVGRSHCYLITVGSTTALNLENELKDQRTVIQVRDTFVRR